MKIFFISVSTFTEPYPVYPVGIDYVIGALSDKHRVYIADMNVVKNNEALIEQIISFSPEIIGISIRNIDNTDTLGPESFIFKYKELIKLIRNSSKAKIVLGGSGYTIFPKEILEFLEADFGIAGEGERMASFVDYIEKGLDVSHIQGVVSRNIDFSYPAYYKEEIKRKFNSNAPHLDFYLKKGATLSLQTKRGCPFKCIYCTYPVIEGSKIRVTPPDKVADDAVMLQKAGAKFLFITDAVFNSDFSHNISVAYEFKKKRLSIPWGAFFKPIKPPKDYFKILADAGLTHVEFGTESLSNSVLSVLCKPFNVDNVFEAHNAAIETGLNVAHFFLLGGPGEDINTLNETLSCVNNLKRSVFFFFCGMRIYPNTKLYDIALEEGQISSETNLLNPTFYQPKSITTQDLALKVKELAQNNSNWMVGSVKKETAQLLNMMYQKGYTGPLWEYLIK